jgi:phosphoglycolate phosphatase
MQKKTILFDFDGTIAATVDTGVSVFNELAHRYGFSEITPENAEMLRGKGPRAVMKTRAIPMLKVPLVLRSLRKGVREALPTLRVVGDVGAAVLALREKGYRLGIVTSNSEENVDEFLANNGMADCFDYLQAGTGIFSKASAIKKLIIREGLRKDDIVFVGDEIRDIEAAKKNRIIAVAVTWGINSREGLENAEPDFVVDNADELLSLLSVADITDYLKISKLKVPMATQ